MKPLNRDRSILEHIISYCEQIEATIDRFGDSYAEACRKRCFGKAENF